MCCCVVDNQEDINKYQKRLVHVTKEHNAETRKLLKLMVTCVIKHICI